jgi:hypothetical protein
MGWLKDERTWIGRTNAARWESGRLPGEWKRWMYRHPLIAGIATFLVVAGVYLALVSATEYWTYRLSIWVVILPVITWWHLKAEGDVFDAWRRANPGAEDRVRDRDVDRDAGFLSRADARNQEVVEHHNEFAQQIDMDDLVSPMARRYYAVRAIGGLVAAIVLLVLLVLM